MKLIKNLILISTVASSAAFAAQTGFFAGVTAGVSQANIKSFSETHTQVDKSTPGTVITNSTKAGYQKDKNNGFAYGIQAGYNLNAYLGFELAYHNFANASGKYTLIHTESIVTPTSRSTMSRTEESGTKFNIYDIDATVNGYYPISNSLDLVGKVGMAYVNIKATTVGDIKFGKTSTPGSSTTYRPVAAIGISYAIQQNMRLAATFTHIFKTSSLQNALEKQVDGKSGKYAPNLNMLALSFNYNFGSSNA